MEEVGRLDSAFCSKAFRSTYLHGIEVITPKKFSKEEIIYWWLEWAVCNKIQLFYRLGHQALPTSTKKETDADICEESVALALH